VNGVRQRGGIGGLTEQDGLAQGLAEQAGHLRGVGAARRDEEPGGLGDRRAVPADSPAVARQQAEQGAQ
jgi:hypothetical protein